MVTVKTVKIIAVFSRKQFVSFTLLFSIMENSADYDGNAELLIIAPTHGDFWRELARVNIVLG